MWKCSIFFLFKFKGWMEPVGKQLASATNGLVILVDYGTISSCTYSRILLEIVPSIGYYLAQFISKFYLDVGQIELIGFGLGAHISGITGSALNGAINRITGIEYCVNSISMITVNIN